MSVNYVRRGTEKGGECEQGDLPSPSAQMVYNMDDRAQFLIYEIFSERMKLGLNASYRAIVSQLSLKHLLIYEMFSQRLKLGLNAFNCALVNQLSPNHLLIYEMLSEGMKLDLNASYHALPCESAVP